MEMWSKEQDRPDKYKALSLCSFVVPLGIVQRSRPICDVFQHNFLLFLK